VNFRTRQTPENASSKILGKKKCKIGPYGWPNLQITLYNIKNNSEVLVIGENGNLLCGINLCLQLNIICLVVASDPIKK